MTRHLNNASDRRLALLTRANSVPAPIRREAKLPPLSQEEHGELAECESSIQKRLPRFYEVGRALLRVRDSKLYRAQYRTFDQYCRERWRIGRFQAYRQIQAAEVAANLASMIHIPMPDAERQIRPLIGLPAPAARAAWFNAVQLANGRRITERTVTQALNKMGLSAKNTPNRESWQDQLEPLLKAALSQIREGDQEAVRDAVFRAWIRADANRTLPATQPQVQI